MTDPSFIVAARKRLNLDQREAAEIFGGGVNAFSRYKTGKTKLNTGRFSAPSASIVRRCMGG